MKLTKNKFFLITILFFLSFMTFVSSLFPSTYVRADDTTTNKFDETNVLDDLKDMTIDGVKFDLDTYCFDEKKDIKVLSFFEFCYSFYRNKQDNFSLYLYIYNPQGLKFNLNSINNTIEMSTDKNNNKNYKIYNLKFLNQSEGDFKGLFLKFKIDLTSEQKEEMLDELNSTSRIYHVSSFELVSDGAFNATDYVYNWSFKYSGYAKGFGPDENSESTLSFTQEELAGVELDVFSTVYRPSYTNGKNEYTQDSLHSVYFAVPNKLLEEYGYMSSVYARWLDAVLKPALVTGNQDALRAISHFLGHDMDGHNEELDFMYLGAYSYTFLSSHMFHYCDYNYNLKTFWTSNTVSDYGPRVNPLYFLFDAGEGEDSARDYVVSRDLLKKNLEASVEKFGGNLINDKYSEYIFDFVADDWTYLEVFADDEIDLRNVDVSRNWWQKLWGTGEDKDYSSIYDGYKAIYPVKSSDMSLEDSLLCETLLIGKSDVEDFKEFYNENSKDSTIFLMRYQVSDYISQQATLFERGSFLGIEEWNDVDSNAYFFQETVNLDFNIINLKFSSGDKTTVVPVVADPIDVIGPGTPPVYWDDNGCDWGDLLSILYIIAGVFLIVLLTQTGILGFVVKIIIWIITAPFKFVGWIIKSIKTRKHNPQTKVKRKKRKKRTE